MTRLYGYFIKYGKVDAGSIRNRMEVAGCDIVKWDSVKKITDPRPERTRIFDLMRSGDSLLVDDPFALAGKWPNLVIISEKLSKKNVKLLIGIDEKIEFSEDVFFIMNKYKQAHGIFQTFAANRSRSNRTSEKSGRPKGPSDKEKAFKAYIMSQRVNKEGRGIYSVAEICRQLEIWPNTYYSYVEWAKNQTEQ